MSLIKTEKFAFFTGWRDVLRISWPLIVANSFWNLQLTIDRLFLGAYSTDALGAAMAVMGVFWTPMALVQQTAGYSMVFVAQYFGASRLNMIGPSIWQSIYLSIIGGLLFLLFIPFSTSIFTFIGHSDRMVGMEAEYFEALCYSALPTALMAAIGGFFSGLGRSQVIMWINCVGLIANVIFDYIMIFGKWGCPPLGIAGAGYATALANWVGAFFAIYLLFSKENELTYAIRSGWRYHHDLMKKFIRYGVPSGMQWALEGLAFSVFLIFVGRMPNGDAALSASGIVVTLMMLAVLPPMGVAQGASVLVGQCLGDKKPNDAEKFTWTALQISFLYILSVGITFVMFPNFYLNWFRNEANIALWQEVSTIVPYLLMYVALFTMFDSMNLVFSFSLKGAGDTKFVTLVALMVPWPFMVLPTWIVHKWQHAIYIAWGAASFYIILQAFIFLKRFRGGKWKLMSVIN